MRLDKHFNVVWSKDFGGLYEDFFNSMAMDENENILLAGSSANFGASFDPKSSVISSLFYMVYIDLGGNLLWETTYQPNPTAQNKKNIALKVLCLKDNSFAGFRASGNYANVV